MTDIKIEKGIPMPDARPKSGIYPFEGMEVGDSFFAPNKTRSQMDNACGHWRKTKGWKFVIRYQEEEISVPFSDYPKTEKVSGSRVWRKE